MSFAAKSSFSAEAWTRIAPIYAAILDHPFNRAFTAGTLPLDRFRRYMLDDAHYLNGFGRALAACAARAPDNDAMTFLAAAGREAIVVERALHEDFFGRFGLTPAEVAAHAPSPTCTGYAATLLQAAAFARFEVAVAALIPCFRIYEEVGRHQMAHAAPDHPYRAWIDTYADPAFVEAVRGIEALADRLAERASAETRAAMQAVYERGSRFEWLFWDAAWRMEGWPP